MKNTVIASAAAEIGALMANVEREQLVVNRVVNTTISPDFNIVVEFDNAVAENSTKTSILMFTDLETCEIKYFFSLLSH